MIIRKTSIKDARMGIEADGRVTVHVIFVNSQKTWKTIFNLSHPVEGPLFDKLLKYTGAQITLELKDKEIRTVHSNSGELKAFGHIALDKFTTTWEASRKNLNYSNLEWLARKGLI